MWLNLSLMFACALIFVLGVAVGATLVIRSRLFARLETRKH